LHIDRRQQSGDAGLPSASTAPHLREGFLPATPADPAVQSVMSPLSCQALGI
jgi:hypothetical protein